MKKEEILKYIENNVKSNDTLEGVFSLQVPMNIGLLLLIGPFAALSIKQYFIAVGEEGMYFHRMSMLGKFDILDYFYYQDIENLSIKRGLLSANIKVVFNNGRVLKGKVPIKGRKGTSKLTEELQSFLDNKMSTVL